jgi:long-chain acyl-CoA synthetase
LLAQNNIAKALEENASRRSAHPAIIEGDTTITYRELDQIVRRISGHLNDVGVVQGGIVGVCLRDSADHLMTLFAVARLGAVILPLDWRWTEAEKKRVTQFFDVALVVVEPGAEIAGFSCIGVDEDWHEAVDARAPNILCAPGGDLPVLLSLSSGTTGRPKGPMLSHKQFAARFVIQWVTLGFSQHDRYLSATPLYFGGGRGFTMGSLFTGGTVIMFPPPYDSEDLIKAIKTYQATTLLLVPTLLRKLLQLPASSSALMGGLNRLLSTGAILHPEERLAVMKQLNPQFINYYGSTEGGGISVLLPKHKGAADKSVGEPVYKTEIQIVDETDTELPANEAGLIRYRGPAVADGFFNDPEASSEAFRDGWFYPGDLGRLDDDGLLYLVGRAKDVIIRSGVNIYPAEIEQVLLEHPQVLDAAAVALPHPERGEDVAAFVVVDGEFDEASIDAHCRDNLASYKIPRTIRKIDELPKTALGKIVKADLVAKLT